MKYQNISDAKENLKTEIPLSKGNIKSSNKLNELNAVVKTWLVTGIFLCRTYVSKTNRYNRYYFYMQGFAQQSTLRYNPHPHKKILKLKIDTISYKSQASVSFFCLIRHLERPSGKLEGVKCFRTDTIFTYIHRTDCFSTFDYNLNYFNNPSNDHVFTIYI